MRHILNIGQGSRDEVNSSRSNEERGSEAGVKLESDLRKQPFDAE
jgi:hypothetical protein